MRELAAPELLRAFRALTQAFLKEIQHADRELEQRLGRTLVELAETVPENIVQNSAEPLGRSKK